MPSHYLKLKFFEHLLEFLVNNACNFFHNNKNCASNTYNSSFQNTHMFFLIKSNFIWTVKVMTVKLTFWKLLVHFFTK